MDAALNWVVDRRAARIVSNSYGDAGEGVPADLVKAESAIFVQAAVEGIGLYFSSGDDGDEVANLGDRTVDWPTSSPWITDVGGTSLGVNARNGYVFETRLGHHQERAHRQRLDAHAARRLSLRQRRRHQQALRRALVSVRHRAQGHQPLLLGRSRARRARRRHGRRPTTGMLVGETQTWSDGSVSYDTYRIGGTSVSCPLFAGVMALADQRAGHAHGFANPALYRRCAGAPTATSSTRPASWRRCAATSPTAKMRPTASSTRCGTIDPARHAAHPARLRRRDRHGQPERRGFPERAQSLGSGHRH